MIHGAGLIDLDWIGFDWITVMVLMIIGYDSGYGY